MRDGRTQYYTATSIDGFIADPANSLDWLFEVESDRTGEDRFADHGLLDEISLTIAPVTLGGGAPLLPRRLASSRLRLVDAVRDWQFVRVRYRVGAPD